MPSLPVTPETRPARETRGPSRTCVGCRQTSAAADLVRFVLGRDGSVAADLAGGAFGRGAWVHPHPRCIGAAPRGLGRAWRSQTRATPGDLYDALLLAANRRVAGLLSAASGAKKLAVGTEAVLGHSRGRVALAVIAKDARAAASSREVQALVARGLAAAWGTKAALGRITGRDETAIAGVLDRGIALSLGQAIDLCHLAEGQRQGPGGDASTEE